MNRSRKLAHGLAAAALLAALAVLLFARLGAYGIWDPWELSAADLARQLASGQGGAIERPPLSLWLVAGGFAAFGIHEWSGRLPLAIAGLATAVVAYLWVTRFAGRRAGLWAAAIVGTSPLLLLHSRQMLGQSPAFLAAALLAYCASQAVFAPSKLRSKNAGAYTIAWLVGAAASGALATLASGVLLGVVPPLLGVATAIFARREILAPERRRAIAASFVAFAAIGLAVGAARVLWADYAGFGWWTGGVPRGGAPPTWEVPIEQIFHSFAPWSALLPLALARMLSPRPSDPLERRRDARLWRRAGGPKVADVEEGSLRLIAIAWAAFAYLAQCLYTARLGPAPYPGVVALAIAVALFVRDIERSRRGSWAIATVVFFFLGLILRDYRGYPSGPIEGLGVEGLTVPEVFHVAIGWAAVLVPFGVLAALGLATAGGGASDAFRRDIKRVREDVRAGRGALVFSILRLGVPIEGIRKQWATGILAKGWLGAVAVILGGGVVYGVVLWIAPTIVSDALMMTSLGLLIGRLFVFVPIALALLIAGTRLGVGAIAQLGKNALVPMLASSFLVGGFTSLWFEPELSAHFSPREVYDTYNDLAGRSEPLGEYRVGGRAAAYYASGPIQEIDSQAALLTFLHRPERVWVAFRADDLAAIDRDFRRREGRHLFVVDARSARMILATNIGIAGRDNQNYLANAILDQAPRPQHPVNALFDNRIELIGYDIESSHAGSVGPGEAFHIVWYFRCLAQVPGGYKPFVHIDGPGQRINGDHEPVEEHYPVRLWEAGDIIVDRQELRVPGNYGRGDLTIYMGFYSGEQRLEVQRGDHDDVNRVRAGILRIR